jgi:hypothetical protein
MCLHRNESQNINEANRHEYCSRLLTEKSTKSLMPFISFDRSANVQLFPISNINYYCTFYSFFWTRFLLALVTFLHLVSLKTDDFLQKNDIFSL